MTFSYLSSGSDDGSFDCDAVIQSVTILGMERKPSAAAIHVPGKDLTRRSTYGNIGENQSRCTVPQERNPEEFFFHSGAADKIVGFQYVELCSMVTVNSLNLRASVDWEMQIL